MNALIIDATIRFNLRRSLVRLRRKWWNDRGHDWIPVGHEDSP